MNHGVFSASNISESRAHFVNLLLTHRTQIIIAARLIHNHRDLWKKLIYIAVRQTIWLKILSETQRIRQWKSTRNGFLSAISVNHKKKHKKRIFGVRLGVHGSTHTHTHTHTHSYIYIYIHVYVCVYNIKIIFPFLASWNMFAETSMGKPVEGSITRDAYRGNTRSK
jgi:hypothetical protein